MSALNYVETKMTDGSLVSPDRTESPFVGS
jgi:hypothetical protein